MAKKVLIGVVVVVALLAFKFMNAGDASADVKEEMREIVKLLPCYEDNAEYLDQQFELRHQFAFDKAYDLGGRRRSASFDADKYLEELFGAMIKDARDRAKHELVKCLQEEREVLLSLE